PGVRLWPPTQVPAGSLGSAEPQAGARAVGWDVTAARTGLATPYPGFAGRYYPDARPDPGAVQR
ncbi:MAG: hypothetical protein QN178_17145, partial [Armatimonadota bacterium]|nr:hypothetical protein [Armatimonadota bacterium]